MNDLPEWVKENTVQLVIGLIGLFLMGFGVWQSFENRIEDDAKIVIESNKDVEDENTVSKLIVDVGGAVENPGVYEFKVGSRINDALVAAGGLSVDANRDFVSRQINRAQVLHDGIKIYIPYKDDPVNVSMQNEVGVVMGSSSVE
jgi:competence protein ComEA